jgi:hypothetical protein
LKTEPSTRWQRACALGKGYVFQGSNADINAGDSILLIKNLSDEILYYHAIWLHPANVVEEYDIGFGSLTATLAGTELTGRVIGNPGKTVSKVSAYGDETAISDADISMSVWNAITHSEQYDLEGFFSEMNQYMQVNQEIEGTSGNATVFCYHSSEAP